MTLVVSSSPSMEAIKMEHEVKILAVDDKPENLLALEALLNQPEYKIVRALSGREALKHLLNQDFALILLDLQMPVMDGFETARIIKQREKSRHIPIIFLTAVYKAESYVFQGYSLGAVDYILKPFDPHILRSKVATFVELYKKNLELKDLNERLQETGQALERANADLQALNKEMESFSYAVSHDLRAPLRSITSFSRLLLNKCGAMLDGECKDFLDRMTNSAHRMGELIDSLLILSRVTREEIQIEQVDLSAIAQSIATELKGTQPERDVQFTIPSGIMANGDPRLLRSVLENLLGNAWKFTAPRSKAEVEFGALLDAKGHRVYFVRDNGVGFDMAHAHKLFCTFERLHPSSQFAGNGIGLANVKRIIQRHGGRAWGEGEPEKGATFYFTLDC